MARRAILILSLFALAFGAASCHLPCREPFWKKPQSMACEAEKPILSLF